MTPLPPSSLSPWSIAERVVDFHARVFSVLRTRYVHASPRDVFTLHCPDWCNVLAVTPDDHVVLIRQFRFGSDTVTVEIPGGMIDPGETPAEAARRELLEESGYVCERLEPLTNLNPNPAIQGNRLHSFVAWNAVPHDDAAGARHGLAEELEECETLIWPRARLPELLDAGAIDHALCAIVLETFLRKHGP